jgi:hypothetical protein
VVRYLFTPLHPSQAVSQLPPTREPGAARPYPKCQQEATYVTIRRTVCRTTRQLDCKLANFGHRLVETVADLQRRQTIGYSVTCCFPLPRSTVYCVVDAAAAVQGRVLDWRGSTVHLIYERHSPELEDDPNGPGHQREDRRHWWAEVGFHAKGKSKMVRRTASRPHKKTDDNCSYFRPLCELSAGDSLEPVR